MATKIDYNQVREMLGTVITDGCHEYVVADYSMSNEMYKCWCKSRQKFYYMGVSAIPALFQVISG